MQGYAEIDGYYQTCVIDYTHSRKGGWLRLISMIHVSDPAYYTTVRSRIQSRADAGATVHYEGVNWPRNLSPRQQAQSDRQRCRNQTEDNAAGRLGLATQRTVLVPAGNWVNTDMDEITYRQHIARTPFPKKVTIVQRNQIALAGAREHLESATTPNLVMIWGANHVRGLHRGLEWHGFRLCKTEWLTAVEIAKLRQFVAIRDA